MDTAQILHYALIAVAIIALIALVVVLIEVSRTLRTTRKTVVELKTQLDPALESVTAITAALEPVVEKVDPLMDRVTLTVDAANLEIMRLDQILEDVSDITDTASNAVTAVDSLTNAPLAAANGMADKIRGVFKAKGASDESARLAQAKEAAAAKQDAEEAAEQE